MLFPYGTDSVMGRVAARAVGGMAQSWIAVDAVLVTGSSTGRARGSGGTGDYSKSALAAG